MATLQEYHWQQFLPFWVSTAHSDVCRDGTEYTSSLQSFLVLKHAIRARTDYKNSGSAQLNETTRTPLSSRFFMSVLEDAADNELDSRGHKLN